MSNGFTKGDAVVEKMGRGFDVSTTRGEAIALLVKKEADADLIAKAFVASTTLATMGYDALECMKALPEIIHSLRTAREQIVAFAVDAVGSETAVKSVQYLDILLTRLRVQEVDNG